MIVFCDACTVDHQDDQCPLDRGAAVCIEASKNGRIMLDPYWLGGSSRHARRTSPALCVLLGKDPVLPLVQELRPQEAARIVASGQLPGLAGKAFAFGNPHLVGLDGSRSDLLRAQHERLFGSAGAIVLNMAVGSVDAAARRLLELVR